MVYASKIILKPKLTITKLNLEIRVNILDTQHNNILNNSPLSNIIEPETRVKTRRFSTKTMPRKNYQSILRLALKHTIHATHAIIKQN